MDNLWSLEFSAKDVELLFVDPIIDLRLLHLLHELRIALNSSERDLVIFLALFTSLFRLFLCGDRLCSGQLGPIVGFFGSFSGFFLLLSHLKGVSTVKYWLG